MNKETTNSHNGAILLIFLLMIPFIFIFSDNEYAFGLILLTAVVSALACTSVKEGYIANESGVTFWKWWKIRTHFDYSSIRSVDVKVKMHPVRKNITNYSPFYTMTIVTDKGKFRFYDNPCNFYDRKVCKDPDSIKAILENSDLMRLKEYMEERIHR